MRAKLFLTPTPVRRQYFAERESAGGTSIRDEPLHFLERLNPGHLLHRGLAPRTANCALVRGVRLECHYGVYLNVNLDESSLKPRLGRRIDIIGNGAIGDQFYRSVRCPRLNTFIPN